MKRKLTLALILVFVGIFTMPLLASALSFGAGNNNNAAKKEAIITKAQKSHEKQVALRQKVDKEMKERLKLIKQGDPGNLGPVAN